MTTMHDVAQRAGVSIATVSHVLNKTRPVSDATADRVRTAVSELGYRRNAIARTLAGGRSQTIGLVVAGLTNTYFAPLLHAIERRAAEAGYILVLIDTHDEPRTERRAVESLLARNVDGIIAAPTVGFPEMSWPLIEKERTPLALLDRGSDRDSDQVKPENVASVRALTTHLIGHGYRRFAVVRGLPGLDSSSERFDAAMAVLAEAGIAPDPGYVVDGESTTEVAEERLGVLLASGRSRPDAILSLNNAMTIGALGAVRRAGLRVPHDVAFGCYDDFEWADLFEPGLTAIAQDVARMGRETVELLLARIADPHRATERRVVDATLHVRTSCGCPPAPRASTPT